MIKTFYENENAEQCMQVQCGQRLHQHWKALEMQIKGSLYFLQILPTLCFGLLTVIHRRGDGGWGDG